LAAEIKTQSMEHTALVWIQIPVENIERAEAFYRKSFGYEFFFETLNNIPHAIFKENANGKRPVNGALIEVKDKDKQGHGSVLFFEATGRFEIIIQHIEQNGGKILVPKTLIKKKIDANSGTIPDTYIDGKPGYFVHFMDSEGNKMGLYGSN
jgi:predicted enzyme related to lactoylglutathione lyase